MQVALLISVFLAIFGVILLWFEVDAIKRGQRAVVSLELRRQFDMPEIQAALAQVRHLGETSHLSNGYLSNGHAAHDHLSNGHTPTMNGHSVKNETPELVEVDQFFSHMGELVRRGIADEEVFALMGPTISEMWHIMRPIRSHPAVMDGVNHLDDFDYLYTEWLNWNHHHSHAAQPHFAANGMAASAH